MSSSDVLNKGLSLYFIIRATIESGMRYSKSFFASICTPVGSISTITVFSLK